MLDENDSIGNTCNEYFHYQILFYTDKLLGINFLIIVALFTHSSGKNMTRAGIGSCELNDYSYSICCVYRYKVKKMSMKK